MKLVITHTTINNVYFDKSSDMFRRLVELLENYPYSYGQMLRAKGKKRFITKHPEYVPPYKDLYDWINEQLPLLRDPFFKISTKCFWIMNGLTDFPRCKHAGCDEKFDKINVELNVGYPLFCLQHSKCDISTIEKRKASCRKKFGTDFPMQSEAVKAKSAATNLKNIGYATPLASPKHRAIGKQTRLRKYNDENYHNAKKARQTFAEHAKDPAFLKGIRKQITETNVRNGHDENWTNREAAVKTRLENHGGDYWTDDMTDKARATHEKKLLANPNYDNEIREKIEKSVYESMGVTCAFNSDKCKQKLREWLDEHGGGDNTFQTDYTKAKSLITMNDRYGVDYAMQSPEIRKKIDFKETNRKGNETKRRNGTLNTSKPEEDAYKMLCERFGKENVERQYVSEAYPFHCDFYIRCIDLYIECNYHWTHGGHWFDPSDAADVEKLAVWKAKGTKFYDIAVRVWSERDVMKRKAAEEAGLNYFVAWKSADLNVFLGT